MPITGQLVDQIISRINLFLVLFLFSECVTYALRKLCKDVTAYSLNNKVDAAQRFVGYKRK